MEKTFMRGKGCCRELFRFRGCSLMALAAKVLSLIDAINDSNDVAGGLSLVARITKHIRRHALPHNSLSSPEARDQKPTPLGGS